MLYRDTSLESSILFLNLISIKIFCFVCFSLYSGWSFDSLGFADNCREKNWSSVKRTITPSMKTNARLTRPLHFARCVSLVGHTSFADHSIRRSRKL